MGLEKYGKQPVEILDYDIDFSDRFVDRTDTPVSVVYVSDTGLDVISATISGQSVRVKVSGGVHPETYNVTLLMTTSSGRVLERDFLVRVQTLARPYGLNGTIDSSATGGPDGQVFLDGRGEIQLDGRSIQFIRNSQ